MRTQLHIGQKKIWMTIPIAPLLFSLLASCERNQDIGKLESYSYSYKLEGFPDTHLHISMKPNLSNFPLILFLHGAGCGSLEHIHPATRRYLEEAKAEAAVLTIDKPGSYHGFKQIFSLIKCPDKYKINNYPTRRAKAILSALNELLKEHELKWNGDLYIVGAHEGAIAAAIVANQYKKTKGLVVLGTGEGFGVAKAFKPLADCLREKNPECVSGSTEKEIILAAMSREFQKRINYRGIRGTGIWWNEMLSYTVSSLLTKYKGPLLVVHGERDTTIEKESAIMLVENLNKTGIKVDLKIYENLNGAFMDQSEKSQKHEVQIGITEWVSKQIAASP